MKTKLYITVISLAWWLLVSCGNEATDNNGGTEEDTTEALPVPSGSNIPVDTNDHSIMGESDIALDSPGKTVTTVIDTSY